MRVVQRMGHRSRCVSHGLRYDGLGLDLAQRRVDERAHPTLDVTGHNVPNASPCAPRRR